MGDLLLHRRDVERLAGIHARTLELYLKSGILMPEIPG
ncbi:unnamed protein product, partial [marine sediment metagenome]